MRDLTRAIQFIESSLQKGDSILVHSLKGQNRSCCVIAAYLINKYRWTLDKALEFLRFRKPDTSLKPSMYKVLQVFEDIVKKKSSVVLTEKWTGYFSISDITL